MGKTYQNGNVILTRDNVTPDSERQVERDDPLYSALKCLFSGDIVNLDFEELGKRCGMSAIDVFSDLHENYGYICIGTGENPAFNETLSPAEKLQRQQLIQQALKDAKLPHILIEGKYMGVQENSYFIPFNYQQIGLTEILRSDVVAIVAKIATVHHQDSLLICQKGYACYLYTTGPQQGQVVTGKTAVVYPGRNQLPDDCYSLFFQPGSELTLGFTCVLNFNRIYASIYEYAAEENKSLQLQYQQYVTTWREPVVNCNKRKVIILMRGTDGYNATALHLQIALVQAGLRVALFGSDANIAKVNEEVAEDNKTGGAKAGWEWPQIRDEFLLRNKSIFNDLISRDDIDVVIYADMNKHIEFMLPYINAGLAGGHTVMSYVVNSFVFQPGRSEYVMRLNERFGAFMGRHVADFNSEKSMINADSIAGIKQFRDERLRQADMVNMVEMLCGTLRQTTSPTLFRRNSLERLPTVAHSNLLEKKL